MEKVMVVARSFQAGTGEGGKVFDAEIFEKRVALPIKRLLRANEVGRLIVVVNGEPGNRLAERQDDQGVTPTMAAIRNYFPEAVRSKRIIVSLCVDWGSNPGSATALNQGLDIARGLENAKWILNWSPEVGMDGGRIGRGLAHAEQHNLSVVGYLRQNWQRRLQWGVAQNTAALWDIEMLLAVEGFAPECNGTGRTITTEDYGEVAVAGMEDFHTMLRMLRRFSGLRWGMVGKEEPFFWDTDFGSNNERLLNHLKKIARQPHVMQIYAQDIFPELSFNGVMDRLFSSRYLN